MLPCTTIIRLALCLSAGTGIAWAAEFAPFIDSSATGLSALSSAILGDNSRITVTPASVKFTGTTTLAKPSTSYAKKIDLGTHGDSFYELSRDGVLFTTGNGVPPLSNTESGFGAEQNPDVTDAELTKLVGKKTHDTTALEFDFTVAPGVQSLGFEFMFMSDEFPEFADSEFVDAAAIYVDGVNYAYYNNDPGKYLSVKSNLISGVSLFYDNKASVLPIEYDGVTRPAGVLAPLNTALATHHLRIAIADTGDQVLDSAIMVADLFGSDQIVPSGSAGIVPLASPRMTNYKVNTKEGAAAVTIPVRLSQPALEPVSVTYELTGTAVLGVDYSSSTNLAVGTISFAVGEYTKDVVIRPLTDGGTDGSKTLTFRLTSGIKAIPLRNKSVIVEIADIDGKSASGHVMGDGSGGLCGAGTGISAILGALSLMLVRLGLRHRREE